MQESLQFYFLKTVLTKLLFITHIKRDTETQGHQDNAKAKSLGGVRDVEDTKENKNKRKNVTLFHKTKEFKFVIYYERKKDRKKERQKERKKYYIQRYIIQ